MTDEPKFPRQDVDNPNTIGAGMVHGESEEGFIRKNVFQELREEEAYKERMATLMKGVK